MEPNHKHIAGIPMSLVGPVDLGRVIRELNQLDNQLRELQIRAPGQEIKMPKTSHMMDELLGLNNLNLLLEADRKVLKQLLETIHARAPRLHISFSADPSPLFIDKIMTWLRKEIHPVLLLTIGMQPNIGAGCLVRTTNKYFDMSLAKDFAKKRDVLMNQLKSDVPIAPPVIPGMIPQPVVTAAPVAAPAPVAVAAVKTTIPVSQGVAA